MATTYPLTYSCYYGGYEAGNTMNGYVTTGKDWKALLFNIFNEMGAIYDTIYYLLGWQSQNKIDIQTDEEMKMFWYRLGAYYGILISLIFMSQTVQISETPADIENWQPVSDTYS